MAGLWNSDERSAVAAALDDVVPGASQLGAVDYVEALLCAFDDEPPRIWAGPSGWLELGPWEQHAWRQRIDEWTAVYSRVIAGEKAPGDSRVVFAHACEAAYGDPVYGGNQLEAGWTRIGFPSPMYRPYV